MGRFFLINLYGLMIFIKIKDLIVSPIPFLMSHAGSGRDWNDRIPIR